MTLVGTIRRRLVGIPSEQAVFSRPGFAKEAWERFQPVAHGLVAGYHATLEDDRFDVLVPRLEAIEPALQGFAYEGAGMALAALDCVAPWKNRLNAFVAGPGAGHIYPIYVGVGLALARLRRNPERALHRLDPVLSWVIVDGYGFHEAFFHYHRTIIGQVVPAHLSAYGRRMFDQGVGRAIWFSSGALIDRVSAILGSFPPARQQELWGGVGLACAYGGGLTRPELEHLGELAGPHRIQLARGATVAALGRQQAGNPAAHTDLACAVFCGTSSTEAAAIAELARANLPDGSAEPAHEIWRRRTRARFA